VKIGALIPVRLTSERLPGKALKEIAGRPVLYYLLDRIAACRHIAALTDIVVCTTEGADDDPLVEAAIAYGVSVFRGDKNDIIKRFYNAMIRFGFDAVVQVDGDDPLTAVEYMDLTMDRLLSDSSLGIVWSEGLPLGTNCKSFSIAAMERVIRSYQSGQNDTGFIYFFTKTDIVNKAIVEPTTELHVLEGARLTLDYDADFDLFTRILCDLNVHGQIANLTEIVAYLKSHPEIMAINSGLDEEYWQRTKEKARLSYFGTDGARVEIDI